MTTRTHPTVSIAGNLTLDFELDTRDLHALTIVVRAAGLLAAQITRDALAAITSTAFDELTPTEARGLARGLNVAAKIAEIMDSFPAGATGDEIADHVARMNPTGSRA